jgi:mono/diheme cytochrome c family protein
MSRRFKYILCAAVLGIAGRGAVVSVAPACESCGGCHVGHANVKTTPTSSSHTRWVTVYENGWPRLVPRNDLAGTSSPATPSVATSATPAVKAQSPTTPAPQAPASKIALTSASSSDKSSDRLALATRAQALLRAKCVRCHGETRRESGLDLSSRATILAGGASGPAVIAGQPDQSLVLQRVRAGEMPPNAGQLSSQEVATLQQWIAAGAP